MTAARTAVTTSGDGTYKFRTPIASRNRCYAVTADLSLAANPAVRGASPAPSASSTFLAGITLGGPPPEDLPSPPGDALLRPLITFVIASLLIFGVAVSVIMYARSCERIYRSTRASTTKT